MTRAFQTTQTTVGIADMRRAKLTAAAVLMAAGLFSCLPPARASTTTLADSPIFGTSSVPGNLLLLLSVEYPTAVDNAFTSDYSGSASNLGYFDPSKCYTYYTSGSDTNAPYFKPYGAASSSHTCTSTVRVNSYTATYSGTSNNALCPTSGVRKPFTSATAATVDMTNSTLLWSGSFLNWATMQTIDPFRWALTGGYRAVDTTTLTVLEKAWASGQGGTGDFPDRTVSGTNTISPALTLPASCNSSGGNVTVSAQTLTVTGVTPFPVSSFEMRVEGQGNAMNFAYGGSGGGDVSTTATAYDTSGSTSVLLSDTNPATRSTNTSVYSVKIRVKVCDSSSSGTLLESNCTQYGSNYKPEGLLQGYSQSIRFGVFGYLNDGSSGRDAGVLRAGMRYVGPIKPIPGSTSITNTLTEWDSGTGIFAVDPGSTSGPGTSPDASATNSAFSLSTPNKVTQSGVINYLNKFGESSQSYKSYDPVSELYYAGIRYFKKENNWSTWTNGATVAQIDGFPVITTWDDPILYACQKNFILGIGDINTWNDANIPGSTITSSAETSTKPTDVSIDVKKATDEVGTLEGLSSLGTTWFPISGASGRSDTYFMAGLAYDAHTHDMRPTDFQYTLSNATSGYASSSSNLDSNNNKLKIQTVSTYWLDVMEYQSYMYQNQFWLAAKYGGFTYPSTFCPKYISTLCSYPTTGASGTFTNSTGTADSSTYTWSNGTDSTFPGVSTAHKKPANYYSAGDPTSMVSGLQSAFASINSAAKATTSELNFLSANVSSGSSSLYYAASYDASNWFGDLKALSIIFDSSGNQQGTATQTWSAQANLDTQASGTGWQAPTRKIATSTGTTNTSGQGIAFEYANVNTYYSSQLSTVDGTSTSAQNLVNYLRGERAHEGTTTGSYHVRTHLLGDIVDSIPKVVGPPSASFSSSTNPGYTSFVSSNSSRMAVVYVGANDGMMHAFDGSSSGSTAGKELFAYVPSFMFSGPNGTPETDGLAGLASPDFDHHFYVDGQITAADIDFNKTNGQSGTSPNWHSIVIGGLGKGGKGYYALDVTSPSPSSITNETTLASKVLWEFTDSSMGYSFGTPLVAKTKKYGWVAMFTSGYNNSDGIGRLYIVNPYTGALLETLSTGVGSTTTPSGLAHATAFVNDYTDGTADAVYAGDLLGNVWRFDLTATSGSYPAPTQFAKLNTSCSSGTAQPVTTNIQLAVDSTNLRYVLVGTGKLLSSTDISDTTQQTFYAIIDGNRGAFSTSGSFPIAGHCLTQNTSLAGVTTPTTGWYYDMANAVGASSSQRVNVDPTTSSGYVFWAGNIPSGDPCSPTGSHYDYVVALGTGKTVQLSTTDATQTTEKSAQLSGLEAQSAFLSVDSKLQLYELTDSGTLHHINTQSSVPGNFQRLNWREIPSPDNH